MNPNHKVIVDGKYEFQFSESDLSSHSFMEVPEGLHLITAEGKSLLVAWQDKDFVRREYHPQIDGNTFEVRIQTPLEQQVAEMGFSLDKQQTVSQIKAPMPGLILEVQVRPGDQVQEEDLLLILEAMKMENAVKSPRSGTIASVRVKKGDAVEKQAILIEFED